MTDKPKCAVGDELKVGPAMDDGSHVAVRHTADHQIRIGFVRPLQEGKPVHGEVFTVEPKDEEHGVYRVQTIVDTKSSSGPAKVNSPAFHDGWERTFGGKQTIGQA